MAKYQVTHSCGHTKTLQLFGKSDQRDWAIERAERGLCTECWKLQKEKEKEEAGLKARAFAAEQGWVVLEGSEKQTLWAETIRLAMLVDFSKLIQGAQSSPKAEALVPALVDTLEWAEGVKSAKWWIDHRGVEKETTLADALALIGGRGAARPSPSSAEWMKHLITLSPHTTLEVAELAGVKDAWMKRMQTGAEEGVKSEFWARGAKLAERCVALGWDGLVKPWWKEKSDGKHYRLYIGASDSIQWLAGRFEQTVKFSGVADTAENRVLAEEVWAWCNSSPDKKLKDLRLK
jgi:hypothetical protein